MFFLSLLSFSYAMPLASDVQVAVSEQGFGFATDYITSIPIEFEAEELSGPYGCWDSVGIRNFNVQTQIKDIEFTLNRDKITIVARFDPIYGFDMQIFAEDTEFWDTCIGYNGELSRLVIENLYFEIELAPAIGEDGLLQMTIVDSPNIVGELDIDLSWFPDGVILYFFEDMVFEKMSEVLQEQIPSLVDDYANLLSYQHTMGDLEFNISLDETQVDAQALFLGGETAVNYTGVADCSNEDVSTASSEEPLELQDISDADVGFSVSMSALHNAIGNLWEQGFFCFSAQDFDELLLSLESLFTVSIDNLSATAGFSKIPSLSIENDRIILEIEQGSLSVYAPDTGQDLIDLVFDLQASIDLNLHPETSSFGISLHDLQFEFSSLQVEGLIEDNPQAQANVKRFIEIWAVKEIEERLQNVSLFQSMFHFFDLYIFVQKVNYEAQGIEVYLNLYREGDAAIDLTPPETDATVSPIEDGRVQATWVATDDREGELMFSYRLDDGSWSLWTTEKDATFNDLMVGNHILQVKSRDRWWNEDQSPAVVSFSIAGLDETVKEESTQGCSGCSTGGNRPIWWLGLVGLLLLRRRR